MNCPDLPLIEFVQGELDVTAVRQVVSHLESCRVCRERVRVAAGLRALQDGSQAGLFSRLRPYGSWIAACVGLLVLVSALYFVPGLRPSDPAQLATRQAHPFFPLDARADPDTGRRRRAFELYAAGDYASAAQSLSQLPADAEVLFYRGVSLYFLGRHQEADLALTQAAAKDPVWRAASFWYQANIRLQSGDEAEAASLLRQVVALQGSYQSEARRLLEQLSGGSPDK